MILASLLAGLGGGILGGYLIAHDPPDDQGGDRGVGSGDPIDRIETIARTVEREARAHSSLARRLSDLETDVSEILVLLARESREGTDPTRDGDGTEHEPIGEAGTDEKTSEIPATTHAGGFDDDLLLSHGADPSEVARLREIWEDHELERAAIADRALREGWFLTERHRNELARLDQALREDLRDEEYDRFLYAQGKPNRLRANDVLNGGAAAAAGLRPGDIILRYGDTRVFTPGELLLATSRADPGRRVPIRVQRNGEERTLYVESGPLGVMIEPTRGTPLDE